MNCIACDGAMTAVRMPCDSDASSKLGRNTWIDVWVCPRCHPETAERYGGGR